MVINCVTVEVFPQLSVNVQVRVMIAGQDPVSGLSVPITDPGESQLSVYASDVMAGTSPIHWTMTGGGGVANTGAVVSDMVISWVTLAIFPQLSVIDQVLVMVAGQLPDGAESVPKTDPGASQLSV